jgi:hypothetical protein
MKHFIRHLLPSILVISTLTLANGKEEIPLNPRGQELLKKYTKELETLRAEVVAATPKPDEAKKARFMELRAQWCALDTYKKDATAKDKIDHDKERKKIEEEAMAAAKELCASLAPALSSDLLDPKLMRIMILSEATPQGLAEFAQQGTKQEKLLDSLFADDALMRQILQAGGANGSEYGESMEVYTAILEKSEKARERGTIFQRLALGTALQMPWLNGDYPKKGVYGITHVDRGGVEQVPRYLHYEKAYLDGELDPGFKDMTTWECRFITNSPYSNEELAWTRQMMRIYRPDHITNPDYKWRYVRFIRTDVPYCSTTFDPSLGTTAQMEIALGGICGRRAQLARLTTRAFGIPSRVSAQTAHGAMSHWTPKGWVICLGGGWDIAFCGPQNGLDFLLDSQARKFDAEYQTVLRAQWLGNAFGEEDVCMARGQYGLGGGFWDSLAFVKKQNIVKDAEVKELELAGGMLLGESDTLLGDEKGDDIEIPEEEKQITTAADGTISIPAVACYSPLKSSDRILFLKSFDKGYQLHYSRLGQRPELFKYNIEVPAEGEYELTCQAATVSTHHEVLVRVNHDEPLPFAMPFTKGFWEISKPVKLKLNQGRNVISVTARTPNRGVSIKSWQLKPVK